MFVVIKMIHFSVCGKVSGPCYPAEVLSVSLSYLVFISGDAL